MQLPDQEHPCYPLSGCLDKDPEFTHKCLKCDWMGYEEDVILAHSGGSDYFDEHCPECGNIDIVEIK